MKKLPLILFPIFLLTTFCTGWSQEIDYKLNKPAKLYIGTPFALDITITSQPGDTLYIAPLDSLDIFLLKNKVDPVERIENALQITDLHLIYQAFDTGEHTFPPLRFSVRSADSLVDLQTGSFLLNIHSTLSDSSAVIRDIADPLPVNLGFWDFLLPLLLLALLIAAIIYLRKFLRKKSSELPDQLQHDSRPSWQICLELLRKMDPEKLIRNNEFLELYFGLSFILRLYIELSYDLKAVEMTTSEIRNQMLLDDKTEKTEILKFLSNADKIKFARIVPSAEEMGQAVSWLQKYLEKTGSKPIDHGDEQHV
ncbi:MAG: hypothetical protein JW996_07650 [Candidatus Cloacimonetes bacterium]|nr:hypothetical protein [Candidatus Cloacimonadota bacterium]